MAKALHRVELTASFLERLDSIDELLTEANASFAFNDLLDELRTTVIPNLRRYPKIGRCYFDRPPQSTEALNRLAELPTGTAHALREYLHKDYLILYAVMEPRGTVYLLSIRHCRQLSFDFEKLRSRP